MGKTISESGALTVMPVGGIYSVIKSKAPVTTAEYGDRYTLIGPLNRASVCWTRCSMAHPPTNVSAGRCRGRTIDAHKS